MHYTYPVSLHLHTQVLHGGWTLFQFITTCSTYRKKVLLGSARILRKVMPSF